MQDDILKDPEMKEVIDDFCQETTELFEQLEEILEELEDDPSQSEKLETFGQIIDRVMGAAKSIGLTEIGAFCELGKTIGYKSSQVPDAALREVVVAILFDALDILGKQLHSLKNGDIKGMKQLNTDAFATRMKWLSSKFKNVQRASCVQENQKEVTKEEKEVQTQDEIDTLMKNLGF